MTDRSSAADSPLAAFVAMLVLPIAIYVAFWVIDWGTHGDSLLQYLLPVAFCVVVPSAIGSTIAAIARAS